MGTLLWGGLGLWFAINGIVATRLINRSVQSDTDSSAIVRPPRQ
jgi:hypothetical protein